MITVAFTGGASTQYTKWLNLQPWVEQPLQIHHTIRGGRNLGVTYEQGFDNATSALQGMTLRNAAGTVEFDSLQGAKLTVSDGITTKNCIVTNVATGSRSSSMAWIEFTLSLRAVSRWWISP